MSLKIAQGKELLLSGADLETDSLDELARRDFLVRGYSLSKDVEPAEG